MPEETLALRCANDDCWRVFHLLPTNENERSLFNAILEKHEPEYSTKYWYRCSVCGSKLLRSGPSMFLCSCSLLVHPEGT